MATAKKKPQLLKLEHDGTVYEVDVDDLDARELGLIERLAQEVGPGTASIYGGLMIAKRRAGETVDEDAILSIKIGRIEVSKGGDADPPARSRARGAK